MNRILLAVALSFAVIMAYMLIASVVVVLVSPNYDQLNASAVYKVDIPLRLPKIVYYYFFPPTAQDYSTQVSSLSPRRWALGVAFFVANILLCSIPVYIVLTVVSGLRKPGTVSPEPPPPSTHLL
jgi:hypothetical protein